MSELLYVSNIEISSEINDKVKADFFLLLISSPLYETEIEEYKTEEGYEFPLSFIEKVIFTHLDTDEFDPQVGFAPQTKFQGYDLDREIYKTKTIKGMGGAAALGGLDYHEDHDSVQITLGSYNMEDYFSEPQVYSLEEIFTVEISIQGGEEFFKINKAQKQELIKKRLLKLSRAAFITY